MQAHHQVFRNIPAATEKIEIVYNIIVINGSLENPIRGSRPDPVATTCSVDEAVGRNSSPKAWSATLSVDGAVG